MKTAIIILTLIISSFSIVACSTAEQKIENLGLWQTEKAAIIDKIDKNDLTSVKSDISSLESKIKKAWEENTLKLNVETIKRFKTYYQEQKREPTDAEFLVMKAKATDYKFLNLANDFVFIDYALAKIAFKEGNLEEAVVKMASAVATNPHNTTLKDEYVQIIKAFENAHPYLEPSI